jgi:hypothetical protein
VKRILLQFINNCTILSKSNFYFFGYGFKNNYFPEIFLNMLEMIKYSNSPINNHFTGTIEEYTTIYNQMKNIYIIRIKAWENLINKQSNPNKQSNSSNTRKIYKT